MTEPEPRSRIKITRDEIVEAIGVDRSYPYIEPRSVENQWKIIHLYGIVGWMISLVGQQEQATVFTGHFNYDPEDAQIEGHIFDPFGTAIIKGSLTPESLAFEKSYIDNIDRPRAFRPAIKYMFTERIVDPHLQDLVVWNGQFTANDYRSWTGRAECSITLFHENAFGIAKPDTHFRPFKPSFRFTS